jgi:hypothetical protein
MYDKNCVQIIILLLFFYILIRKLEHNGDVLSKNKLLCSSQIRMGTTSAPNLQYWARACSHNIVLQKVFPAFSGNTWSQLPATCPPEADERIPIIILPVYAEDFVVVSCAQALRLELYIYFWCAGQKRTTSSNVFRRSFLHFELVLFTEEQKKKDLSFVGFLRCVDWQIQGVFFFITRLLTVERTTSVLHSHRWCCPLWGQSVDKKYCIYKRCEGL